MYIRYENNLSAVRALFHFCIHRILYLIYCFGRSKFMRGFRLIQKTKLDQKLVLYIRKEKTNFCYFFQVKVRWPRLTKYIVCKAILIHQWSWYNYCDLVFPSMKRSPIINVILSNDCNSRVCLPASILVLQLRLRYV